MRIVATEDGFDGIESVVEIESRLEGLQMGNVGLPKWIALGFQSRVLELSQGAIGHEVQSGKTDSWAPLQKKSKGFRASLRL